MITAKISPTALIVSVFLLVVFVVPQNLFASVTVYETQSKRDFLSKVYADQRANGGVNEKTAAHGYPQYPTSQVSPTGQRVCSLYDPTAWPSQWSLGGFKSPGGDSMAAWDPTTNRWFVRSANSFGNKRYNYITCKTDAKADTSLTANGVSEVTINAGESVNLSWYSQYGAIRKAACTATNFTTVVTVPANTATVPRTTCGGGPWGFDNFLSFVDSSDTGNNDCSTIFTQVNTSGSSSNQPFSGTKSVSPTQTTTYTYSCANANGTNTSSVTVNVIQPEVEPIAVSCSPSPSSGVTNEPITWTAQIFNHDGPFTYLWEGSDGLTGTTASVVKSYVNTGTKTARVTVSFEPEEPTTPTPVTPATPTCLAGGSEVPAGYLCSSAGLTNVAWGQCCSGYARVQCPAPNEPAEAYCTGRTTAVTTTPTPQEGAEYDFVMTHDWDSDPTLWADVAVSCRPSTTCNFECNAATVGRTCRAYICHGAGFRGSEVYQCQQTATAPTTPTPQPEEGFSITTDCDGTVCSNRTCSADPGGSGGTTPSNPNSTPGDPSAPTWGVTINLPGQCYVGPMCVGASIHNQSLDCSKEFVRTCPFGCISGQCVAPQPEIDLSISPAGVRRDESCTVQVAARHVSRCRISGLGISQVLEPNAAGVVESQSFVTPGMVNSTSYSVSCESPRGTVEETVQCTLLPVFRET